MLEQLTVATPGLSSDHVAMSEYFWLQWIVITVYDIMSAYKAEGSCCDSMVNLHKIPAYCKVTPLVL